METISVVIITLNEEGNIRECLESVKWADEIVILDSGSTDRTLKICREYTDHVYHRDWDAYAPQRNAAHDKAGCDWILSLDADERISAELAEEIKEALHENGRGMDGYKLAYKVYYRGKWLKHGGFFPEKHVRLFRRGKGAYGERAVHEALKVSGQVGEMKKGFVEHHSYSSVSDYIIRMDRYSSLSAEEYSSRGRKTGPFRMTMRACYNFINMYLLRAGFLDGYEGFLMAMLYSIYTFTKYAKLKELNEPQN